MEMIRLASSDLPRLSELCRACTAYYELVEGQPATENSAAEILGAPDARLAHGTKHVWGIESHDKLIGVAELLQHHPAPDEWYIGLLLVAPPQRRNGLGTRFCKALLDWMATQGARTVRLGVHERNAEARRFWERQGFSHERDVVTRVGLLEGRVSILVHSPLSPRVAGFAISEG
jgi:GNAT superfamily N-acetyltransferase